MIINIKYHNFDSPDAVYGSTRAVLPHTEGDENQYTKPCTIANSLQDKTHLWYIFIDSQ